MNNQWYLVDNEMGLFIRASRESKEYTMEEKLVMVFALFQPYPVADFFM